MERISENQLLILKLLAKALFNIQIKLPEKIDWNGICKESITQTVLPLIYKVLGEVIPPEGMGLAVMNRLGRAAAFRTIHA